MCCLEHEPAWLRTCQAHALPTPATAPEPAAAAEAAAPPAVSGAEEWRGEKYILGISCTGRHGCPCSHLSASVHLGRGTCNSSACDLMCKIPAAMCAPTCLSDYTAEQAFKHTCHQAR